MSYKYFMIENTQIDNYSPLHRISDDSTAPTYWNRHDCIWSKYQSGFSTPERLLNYLNSNLNRKVSMRWVTEEEANKYLVIQELSK